MAQELQPSFNLTPGANLDAYMHAVNTIPMLTAERERELAERLYYEEDVDAARQLVLSHLRFVVYIARSYSGYGLSESDLIQEGNVGLMKAVKRFNPEFGVRLISFAVHWIRAEIHEFILRNWRIVKVATTKAQRKLFFNLRGAKRRIGWMNDQEVAEVAGDLGVKPSAVREMETRLSASDEAFDPMDGESEESRRAPAHYLEDAGGDPASIVERETASTRNMDELRRALGKLDSRSADIVEQRWLREHKATLHDLAEKYGISAERVRQVEQNALRKLRVTMEI